MIKERSIIQLDSATILKVVERHLREDLGYQIVLGSAQLWVSTDDSKHYIDNADCKIMVDIEILKNKNET